MEKQSAIMVVSTNANPAKEDAYNQWYDEHVKLIFTYPGMQRISRNRCLRPLGDAGENSPRYITIYELNDKEDIENFFRSSQMQEAKTQFDEGWPGLGDVLWSGWYEPVRTLERKPITTKRYTEIVGSGPKPGKDTDYLDYYTHHFTDMFEYGGIINISYVYCFQPLAQESRYPGYITVYDFENEKALDDFYRDPIFTGAKKEWDEVGQPAMDLQWAACYESVITLLK